LGKIPRQFFTNEFKEEAVKLVIDGKLTIAEAARRLSLCPQTLKNWVTKHRSGNLNVPDNRSVSELEAEVSKLRKELAEARLEKEIIKKAMAYLAKGSQPGTR
jgi:transposase